MKITKFFKYGFLATFLFGNTIAMEDDECIYGQQFPLMMSDVSRVIVSNIPYRDWPALALTCKSWFNLIYNYRAFSIPCKDFKEINMNLHYYFSHDEDLNNVGFMPESLCIFLPFQENTPTEEITVWNKTTGWCINGYTNQVQPLTPFDGEINCCANFSHPQGTILQQLNGTPNLITITATTIQNQPVFQDIEEAKGFANFLCNKSYVIFPNNQQISCYSLETKSEKRTVNLTSYNHRVFNFGEKFLAIGCTPNSLCVINPELDTLIEKRINLPTEIVLPEINLCYLTSDSDNDSALLNTRRTDLLNQPISYFIINNISTEQPTTSPVSFLPEKYSAVECYLKNNYIFSIASLMNNETIDENPSLMAGKTVDVEIHKENGTLIIYDLVKQKKCFEMFFPSIPLYADFIGNTIFVETAITSKKTYCDEDCDDDDCPGYYFTDTTNLLGFNIKSFLS